MRTRPLPSRSMPPATPMSQARPFPPISPPPRAPSRPLNPGAFQSTPGAFQGNPQVAFVTKLNAAGSALVYSTYLGVTFTTSFRIAVDAAGNAYVTGATASEDFPTTAGAFQTTKPGFSDG